MPPNHLEGERCGAFVEHIRTSRNFVCGYGRDAVRNGLIKVLLLPPSDAPREGGTGREEIQHMVFEALPHLRTPDAALCFVEPSDPADHAAGEERAWDMQTELAVAGFGYSVFPETREDQRPRFASEARRMQKLPMIGEYLPALPRMRSTRMFQITVAPLYPERHMRYNPVTAHVVTRMDDLMRVTKSNPGFSKVIHRRMFEDGGMPYVGDFPYVIPGDARHVPDDFLDIKRKIETEMAGREMPAGATTHELARRVQMRIIDESTEQVVLYKLKDVRAVLERVIAGGRW